MTDNPEIIGKYRIQSVLGQGAMGIVYQAYDPDIDRLVAIKTIRSSLLDGDLGEELLRRFRTEVKAAGKISHPAVVSIYEFEQQQDTPYFVMEYVDGRDLKTRLKSQEIFTLERASEIIIAVLEGLDYIHDFDIIHRDIKPANIFITESGHVKIADFGIARIDDSDMTQVGSVLGTPSYMSPEQCQGATLDCRSDLFSVGVVFYELITGKKPFYADQSAAIIHNVINNPPVPPQEYFAELPDGYQRIIETALHKEPAKRFQTARAFHDELERCLRDVKADNSGVQDATAITTLFAKDVQEAIRLADSKDTEQWGNSAAAEGLISLTKPMLVLLVIVSALVGVLSLSFFFDDNEFQPQSSINAIAQQQKKEQQSAEQKAKLNRLLTTARAHFDAGRLVSPQGSNALDTYKMVLSEQRYNNAALEGIHEVTQRFFKRAHILISTDREAAVQHLTTAKEIFPDRDETRVLENALSWQ